MARCPVDAPSPTHDRDAYRELNNVTGIVVVTTDGFGRLNVEHKNPRDEIEAVLKRSTWKVVNCTEYAGQYPTVDVVPEASVGRGAH